MVHRCSHSWLRELCHSSYTQSFSYSVNRRMRLIFGFLLSIFVRKFRPLTFVCCQAICLIKMMIRCPLLNLSKSFYRTSWFCSCLAPFVYGIRRPDHPSIRVIIIGGKGDQPMTLVYRFGLTVFPKLFVSISYFKNISFYLRGLTQEQKD